MSNQLHRYKKIVVIWTKRYMENLHTGYAGIDLHRIRLGMTRDQIVELFGEPDAKSIGTRKHKIPLIYKYGIYELTFDRYKDSGLIWVFDDNHNKIL